MSRKKLIWIIAGSVVAALFVAAVIYGALNAPKDDEGGGNTGGGGGTITQTPAPTPTAEPEEEHNHEGGDALGSETNVFEDAKVEYAAAAEGFLTEYLRWDSNESAEDRAARLAPYVAPDSPLLTKKPGISLESDNPTPGYQSITALTWIDQRYTGWAMPDDGKGNELFMAVMGNYKINQNATGGLQNTFWESSARWTVQFAEWDGTSNPVIIDVREPKYTK